MRYDYLDVPHREGYFELNRYDLYFREFGTGETAMLVLHGGPGSSGDHLTPLGRHGSDDLRVFLYDQLGSGRSDSPPAGNFDRYTVEHFREEVEAVRAEIGVDSLIVYGSSWGGMLAQEYALAYPDRVDGLILQCTLHDTADAIKAMRAARAEVLTDEELERALEFEAEQNYDADEYQDLTEKVYDERLLRVDKPIWWEKAETNMDAYGLMWGQTEFALADHARLRGWSTKDRLGDIACPTLVIVGEYDEIGPEISRDIADRIPDAELTLLKGASHATFLDAPEAHYTAVENFLERIR